MGKITGRVKITLNGVTLLNKSGATASGLGLSGISPSVERKEVIGDTGIHGFVETVVPAVCEVTVTDRDDINLDTFAQINGDGEVIFEAAGGGKQYTMTNATCTANFTLTAGEGDVGLRFVGNYWTEATV